MAYVSAEYVKSLQKTHDSKFWKVYDGSGKILINKCDQDIGLSASQDLLQETLENCIGDSVTVKLYTKQPERREAGVNAETGLTLKVRLDSNPVYNQKSNYQSGIGQPSWMDMMAMSDKMRQIELDKLRMELEADKEEHPMMSALYKAMENPTPILQGIGAMISMIMNKNNPTAQIGQNTTTAEIAGSIEDAISKFQQVDPDYVNVLSKFADWAKNNPEQYSAVKSSI
jgi:hypothetical protein